MSVSLTYIYNIAFNICLDYEYRILMTTDIKSLTLTDCIELRTIMLT